MSLKMEAASLREIKNRMIVIKDRIRDHEGFEINPYTDTLGFLTGGVAGGMGNIAARGGLNYMTRTLTRR